MTSFTRAKAKEGKTEAEERGKERGAEQERRAEEERRVREENKKMTARPKKVGDTDGFLEDCF